MNNTQSEEIEPFLVRKAREGKCKMPKSKEPNKYLEILRENLTKEQVQTVAIIVLGIFLVWWA